jgi:hypothetical protein
MDRFINNPNSILVFNTRYSIFNYCLCLTGSLIHFLISVDVIDNHPKERIYVSIGFLIFHFIYYLIWYIGIHLGKKKKVGIDEISQQQQQQQQLDSRNEEENISIRTSLQKRNMKVGMCTVIGCIIFQTIFLIKSVRSSHLIYSIYPREWIIQKIISSMITVLYFWIFCTIWDSGLIIYGTYRKASRRSGNK